MFKVPLFRLDIGSLMGKFVGESEANMKVALNIAEKASPCVLWIDELEKAFSGVNGSGGSTEITTRLFGYFLIWMQEKPGAVFVAATANDITTIPPELLRRGRFDEIFYVDIPSPHEREQIFKVHFEQRYHSVKGLDLEALAEKTDGFSGADIECVINDSLENIFRQQQSTLSQEVLEKHINLITPISKILEKKIDNYRKLFSQFQLKPASFSDVDLKKIVELSDSDDPVEREIAASNEFIPPAKLSELIRDNNLNVRNAVLNNPNCPASVLKSIVDSFAPLDFSKRGCWNDNETTIKEFNAALKHPNMTGEILFDLHNRQKIKAEELLPYIGKLSDKQRSLVFQTIKVKLSKSIPFAIARKIRCSVGSIVKKGDILIDIDDQNLDNHSITAPVNGLLSELSVNIGERINSGHVLAKMITTRM